MAPKKIMIVDDSVSIVGAMASILVNAGYAVETVTDSALLFDGRIERFGPDLFLVDINMPKFDGFYVVEHIKKTNVAPGAKVVMCSTKFFEHDRARAKGLGADDFLVKPFDFKALLDMVESAIG